MSTKWSAATLVIGLLLVLAGCEKKSTSTPTLETSSHSSSPPLKSTPSKPDRPRVQVTSFDAVARRLDAGGTAYLYLSTESFLAKLSSTLEALRADFGAVSPDPKADAGIGAALGVLKRSGVEQVGGLGMSSIAIQPGLFRNVLMVHKTAAPDSGFLWRLNGRPPHVLDTLTLLPANTALASISDLDFKTLWQTIRKEAVEIGGESATTAINGANQAAEANLGVTIDGLVAALAGEYGIIVTLDESRKVKIPLGADKVAEIPDPAIAILFKCGDPTLFDKIVAKGPLGMEVSEKNGLRIATIPAPTFPPDGPRLAPVLAMSPDYLFLCSKQGILDEIIHVRTGKKPGLTGTDFYQKFSQGLPEKGNAFQIMQESFMSVVHILQKQSLAGAQSADPFAPLIQKWITKSGVGSAMSVTALDEDGLVMVANSSQDGGRQLVMFGAIAPAAIAAAVAAPNFLRARDHSQSAESWKSDLLPLDASPIDPNQLDAAQKRALATTVLKEIRMLDSAIDQWAIEQIKKEGDQPVASDLAPYVKRTSRQFQALQAAGSGTEYLDPLGNKMVISALDKPIKVPAATFQVLSDVVPKEFWKPFQIEE